MWGKAQMVGSSEFLLLFGLPSLAAHLLGSLMLIAYYRTLHPWRAVGPHCCCKLLEPGVPVRVERGAWEVRRGGDPGLPGAQEEEEGLMERGEGEAALDAALEALALEMGALGQVGRDGLLGP